MTRRAALLACAALFASSAFAAGQDAHIVRLLTSKRQVDPSSPWQYESVRQQTGLAVVVPGGRLLTTAFAVADATLVEMQRFGASRKVELAVSFVDYEANLALVAPKDPAMLGGLTPIELGEDLAIDDGADIYRARDAYQLVRMTGTLAEVGVFAAVTSSYSLASYQIKVQQTGLGWSEPVLKNGRLVGLTTGQDSDFVHAMPVSLIKHFLGDQLKAGGYRGFPSIGVSLSGLASPDQRRRLKADKSDDGVRIARVLPGSSFAGKLQADDVLLEVDGVTVSEYGYYAHPKWGKVHLKHLLNQRYGGDRMKLKILRAGVPMTVEGVLTRFDSNQAPVAAYTFDAPEAHVIFGGLIFQELSQEYLKQWGKDWRDVAPLDLLYTLDVESDLVDSPGRRYVFLNRILADDVNRGYGDLRRLIVDAVNDRPVRSLADLRDALAHPVARGGKPFAKIHFTRDGGDVIIAYEGLEKAHARIAATYSVITPESFFPKAE